MFTRPILLAASLLVACSSPAGLPAAKSPPATDAVQRSLLATHPLTELPGWESRIYLIDFPPGAESPLHEHPVAGIGYVLEGTFESAFGEGPATTKHAGESFVDLPLQPHHFRNPDSQHHLRFVIAGTFRKGDPLFRPLTQ
jgi:quercetin dioxygenase-like cupin family protein